MASTRCHSRYASHSAAMPPEAATSDKAGPGKPDGAGAAMVIDGQSSGRQRAGACSARASGSTAKDQPPVASEPAKRGARPPGRGAGTIGGAIARIAAQEFLREVRAIISFKYLQKILGPPVDYGLHAHLPKLSECKAKTICRFPQRPSFWLSAYKAQILNPSLADFAGKRPQIETIAARRVPGGDGLPVSCRAGSDGSTRDHAPRPRLRKVARRSDR